MKTSYRGYQLRLELTSQSKLSEYVLFKVRSSRRSSAGARPFPLQKHCYNMTIPLCGYALFNYVGSPTGIFT